MQLNPRFVGGEFQLVGVVRSGAPLTASFPDPTEIELGGGRRWGLEKLGMGLKSCTSPLLHIQNHSTGQAKSHTFRYLVPSCLGCQGSSRLSFTFPFLIGMSVT